MKRILVLTAILVYALAAPLGRAQSDKSTPATAAPAPAAIPADQQATKDQMDQLFEAMHLREQMQSILKMMPAMIQQQLAKGPMPKLPDGTELTADQQKAVQNLRQSYFQKSMNLYTADEMMADMASIYQRHFTRTDVDAYIAFYRSPAGQHLLAAQPVIMQEYMPMIMQRMQERSKALADQQRKDMDELLKSFSQPSSTAKPYPTAKPQ